MNMNQTGDPDDDAQAEAFFEALAGRARPHDGAAALRTTILAESEALRTAHAEVSPEAARRNAETFAQLRKEGVFADVKVARAAYPPPHAASPSLFASWRQQLNRLLAAPGFYPALAGCAAVACLLVVVPGLQTDHTDPHEVLRGSAPHTLAVADPEAYVQSLAGELRAVGAQARIVQINDRTWTLSVTAPQPSQADAAKAVLQGRGWPDIARFPIELTITTP